MTHIRGERQSGKTSRLIAKAVANDCDILVPTYMMAQAVAETASHMGLEVSKDQKRNLFKIEHIYIFTPNYHLLSSGLVSLHTGRGILIDEIDIFLKNMIPNLEGYTVTVGEEIELGDRMFPKKPIVNVPENDDPSVYFKCPTCGTVHNRIDIGYPNYCPYCGHELNWKDTNNA